MGKINKLQAAEKEFLKNLEAENVRKTKKFDFEIFGLIFSFSSKKLQR